MRVVVFMLIRSTTDRKGWHCGKTHDIAYRAIEGHWYHTEMLDFSRDTVDMILPTSKQLLCNVLVQANAVGA